MRRVIVLGLAVLLALPSAALALTRVLHGPAGPVTDSSVDVHFKYRGTHAKVITRFEFNNIPVSCQGGGSSAVSDVFPHHIGVSQAGKFHAKQSANSGRATYVVRGRFSGVRKASGTLHITGTEPACLSANSGVVHWSAKFTGQT